MSTQQQTLDGETPPETHLDATSSDKTREYRCSACDFRVTRSPSAPIEYGHNPECDHWIGRGSFTAGGDK